MKLTGPAKWYNPGGFLGQAGEFKNFLGTKKGAILSGRAVKEGGAYDRDMGGAHVMDAFVSPATTGTSQQTAARIPPALVAAWWAALAGGAAAGAGSAGTASSGTATSGSSAGAGSSSGSFPLTRMAMNMTRGQPQQRPAQQQPPAQAMNDPYGLQASGLPAYQDPRARVMQALIEQGAMNG